jgi:GT2 family glycosyltransferase/glycosyltransferase involved in cell wall biosynthesis
MVQHRPLRAYAFEDLLVLFWRRNEKLAEEVDILVNGSGLERPIIGTQFVEQPLYLLAVRAPGLDGERSGVVQISAAADARILAERVYKMLRPIPARLVAAWSLASRLRVEKLLIRQVGSVFPQLSAAARLQIAASLAEPNATILTGPNAVCYVRMPWPFSGASGLLDASLQALSEAGSGGFAEPVTALIDGHCLHFFSRHALAYPNPNGLWLFDAGKLRCVPFKLARTRLIDTISTEVWVDRIAADYQGDRNVLRGYAGMVLNPPKPRAGRGVGANRLLGKVEGLRAGRLVGWALDPGRPNTAIHLRIEVNGEAQGEVEADLPRPELELDGYVNCGFLWQPDARWMVGEPQEIRVFCSETGAELNGSPLRLGRGEYDGDFDLDEEGCLVGWIRERCSVPGQAALNLLIDGESCTEARFDLNPREGEAEDSALIREISIRFRTRLPDRVFDTDDHTLEIEISNSQGQVCRLDRVKRLKTDYRGHIDVAGPGRVAGWVVNTLAPNRPVTLDLLVNGTPVSRFKADRALPERQEELSGRRCGFDIAVPPQGLECATVSLEIRLAGTQVRVLGPPVIHTPYDVAIRSLVALAELLNDEKRWGPGADGPFIDEGVAAWLCSQVLAPLVKELRREKSLPGQVSFLLASETRLPHREPREAVIDVIVPVYQARDEVFKCIASVLEARGSAPMELVVINDASPDPELNTSLRCLAAEHGFLLLENSANLGFVATANRGMRLHPERDVVLLNSDTVVPKGWLDRLRQSAYGARNIGTVTPFSNNATICSFPQFCRENPIPSELSLEQLDGLFAEVNPGQTVDLPTAVGFCMYIKRAALDEVGYFDESQWAKGYGEENDFCLRASALGWRHVAACDVFVEHKGASSFGERKRDQLKRNLTKLNSLYPDYAKTIQRFIFRDPLAASRNRVLKALLKQRADRYLLFLIHGLGGGTQVAADDLALRLMAEGVAVIGLKCLTPTQWSLGCHGFPYEMQYRYPNDFDALLQDLRDLGVWHIHYQHAMQFPRRLWELPALLGTAYDFTAHDYLPICPRINMIDESGIYCGDSQYSAETCTRCIKVNGPNSNVVGQYAELGGNVAGWRAGYGDFLRGARRVFAPSYDAARRLRAHFQLLNVHVEPHPEPTREIFLRVREGRQDTVAVLGAIGLHKGYEILLRCVRNAAKEGLPLKFVVIGFTSDNDALLKYDNVVITGQYRIEDLPRHIKASGAQAALFLSPWPETYSYTLSEAWRNGLYPIAFDLGAIAERIRKANFGRLMPLTTDPRIINRTVLEVLKQECPPPVTAELGRNLDGILRDYYGLNKPKADGIGSSTDITALPFSGAVM